MTAEQVNQTVIAIYNMNNEQLNQVIAAVKLQRTYLTRQQAVMFRIGDTVSFAARNQQITGTVTKVNTKTVQVKQTNSLTVWRVHASLLKKI
jgi:hypothetical protein